MDRQSSKADAYVEIRFANQYPMRTSIARKTLDPVWNESFRLEINDDAYLQNDPLEFRLLDYDSITANDLIGSVYIDLNSLLTDEFEVDGQHTHNSSSNSSSSKSSRSSIFDNDTTSEHESETDDLPAGPVNDNNSNDNNSQSPGQSSLNGHKDLISNASDQAESHQSENLCSDSGSDSSSDASSVTSSHESSFIGETTGVPNTYTRTLGGWFPIYDTMWGIRGELKCQVILQYFGDVNPFNNSSAGIQVFSTPSPHLPPSIPLQASGFISSIVTHIDPEYHWTDSFRTPRASNEARVRVLHKITGLLRRRMGRKALELGANAIVGYRQWFDFEEEEKSITGRAVGTAVRIGSQADARRRRLSSACDYSTGPVTDTLALPLSGTRDAAGLQSAAITHTTAGTADGNDAAAASARNRRPSTVSHTSRKSPSIDARNDRDSDATSAITQSTGSSLSTSSLQSADNLRNQKYADACEILTFKSFTPGVIHRLGGLVSATSVKLIENDQSRTRELWFDDLRAEIKHHALAVGCSHIIGYTEQVAVREDILILMVYGTAAVLDLEGDMHEQERKLEKRNPDDLHFHHRHISSPRTHHRDDSRNVNRKQLALESPVARPIEPLANADTDADAENEEEDDDAKDNANAETIADADADADADNGRSNTQDKRSNDSHKNLHGQKPLGCRMCHASHDRQKLPYPMRFFRCGYCQKKAVPEILLTTVDVPLELDVIDGESCMIEAHICRPVSKAGTANVTAAATQTSAAASDGKDTGTDTGEHKRWFGLSKGSNAGPEVKLSGEAYAVHISDALPFIHYDLHRQLLYKLSVHGMNAIFGLKYQFSIGEDMIIAVAAGTAVYVTGLPTPGPLHIKRNIDVLDEEDRAFIRIQDRIMRLSNANRRRLDCAFRKKRRAMIRLREQRRRPHARASSVSSRRQRPRPAVRTGTGNNKQARSLSRRRDHPASTLDRFNKPGYRLDRVDTNRSHVSNGRSGSESKVSDSSEASGSSDEALSRRAEVRRKRKIRARVAVQIDDDADEDLMAALLDIPLPPSFILCNVERPPLFRKFFAPGLRRGPTDYLGLGEWTDNEDLELSSSSSSSSSSDGNESSSEPSLDTDPEDDEIANRHALQNMQPDQIQMLALVKRATVDPYSNHPNRQLAELFNSIYLDLYTTLAYFSRCAIVGVDYKVQVVDETPHDVQVLLTATVIGELHDLLPRYQVNVHLAAAGATESLRSQLVSQIQSIPENTSIGGGNRVDDVAVGAERESSEIELTTLSYLPRCRITAHVGRISLHFVQEVHIDPASKGPVGMGAFVFSFIAEVQAMARAHVAARGGMAMIALSVDQIQIIRDVRSEAYATMSISGDVIRYKKKY
ncbi:hypothetical protein LPJ64_006208 [Coemansia asiatica]|uniref:C2 domain-containing protein n=1 Tax=Coemansia asiatica TaxID=1052880 RepID=A0A9W8CHB3_9FUNG|nr:hypothetical protein LPJ64_006208 [Coemansia asiatica]